MHRTVTFILTLLAFACERSPVTATRPIEPWAFRSVLDKKPRILTLALDSSLYAAYDLQSCSLYKVWKGGVLMEGAAYTDKKNVQPTSWGEAYVADTTEGARWSAVIDGRVEAVRIVHRGHYFRDNGIHLEFALVLPHGDTIQIEEHPEFVRNAAHQPGLLRRFTTRNVPGETAVRLQSANSTLELKSNGSTTHTVYFNEPPNQTPPRPESSYDHRGRYWMEKSDCMTCHEPDRRTVGPAFQEVAAKYPREKTAIEYLIRKVRDGGAGVWGTTPMNAHPALAEREIREMISYILSLKPADKADFKVVSEKSLPTPSAPTKPGFGAPLSGVHPSFDLQTIHDRNFRPRVGGLAFLPDARLLVTTWDVMGAVYLLDGVESGDTSKISVKRVASGLAEPLGIEVVDGEIYVLQKHELTRLRDLDGDDVIDRYEAVCNSWGVTGDFHEFAFGLIHKDGYFYATLSLAMRLMSHEKQKSDRGRTIRISKDGTYEWINFGLRTPNGIGLGVDGQVFVTDNQGEWTPANKLIHVKRGEFLGMRWGLTDESTDVPPIALPAIWLPQDEIGNSPSEPILITSGPYKGQMLHGDVTHGGIKRDFLEKIDGEYQGAVFRFTQGLEAGVNRLCWGPDGALYIGGVGMVGGWSWKGKQYGLQKLVYNGKTTFEMLAVRARRDGFEIEVTEALKTDLLLSTSEFEVQQWRYESTPAYGGPKLDLQALRATDVSVSEDRKRIYLRIPGLKEQHVVHIALPEHITSDTGQSLWSNETWYTLNNIPN